MIKGLTDTLRVSWDGKIRSGYKQNGTGSPVNTPHFLLHDAPGLEAVLGEKPTEYFGTFLYDDPEAVMKMDLRWYKKSALTCQGNGESAAFFEMGDHPGVLQTQAVFTERDFLGRVTTREIPRSRSRVCRFKNCPDFVSRKCRPHLFLSLAIPQFSMASIFTLDSVSEYTQNSILAERERAMRQNAVLNKPFKISGEIFRIYKQKEDVKFLDVNKGKTFQSEKDVVLVEWIPFSEYETKFKDKIKPEHWDYLIAIRSAGLRFPGQEFTDASAQLAIEGGSAPLALTDSSQTQAVQVQGSPIHQQAAATDPVDDTAALKAKANHESVLPLFEKLSALVNKPNSEDARIATARNFVSATQMADYLTKKIKDVEKKQAAAAVKEQPAIVEKTAEPAVIAAQAAAATSQPTPNLFQ